LENGDLSIRQFVKASCDELPLPKRVVVPPAAKSEHSSAIFGGKDADEPIEAADEYIPESLTSPWQRAAGQPTSPRKVTPQIRALASGKSARIAIKSKGKIFFVDAAEVIAVEAKGNYSLLLRISGSHMLRQSISTMEKKLNQHGFVRIHRSVLVNAAAVEEIHPRYTGEYVLRVRGGREFIVTRTYKCNLRLLAQLWIGTEGFADA
jgi:DNA-binding LytR/AlgR family response regulator